MENLEHEFKTLITAEQAQAVLTYFPFQPSFSQTNYYFDTARHVLAQHKIGLRIRLVKGTAEQTLKLPNKTSDHDQSGHTLTEYTTLLTPAQQAFVQTHHQPLLTPEIKAYCLPHSANNPLILTGQATTERHEARLNWGLLVVDHTYYPDKTDDYELECEVSNRTQTFAEWQRLLTHFEIQQLPLINKSTRMTSHQILNY